MVRVWIDTDVGTNADDAFCIALAALHPDVELAGVSTVYGDVALRARCAERVLELAGCDGAVPVGIGLGRPMTPSKDPVMWGHEGKGLLNPEKLEVLESATETAPGFDAQADLIHRMSALDEDTWLVGIGPATNLGWMQREHPVDHRISLMGGSTDSKRREWNWDQDPVAVEIVLDSDRHVRVHPIQITRRVVLGEPDLDRMATSKSDLARVLADQTRRWLAIRPETGRPGPNLGYMHDPVALISLIEPDMFEFEQACIELDAEARLQIVAGEPNCEIAVDIDERAVKDLLLSVLLQGG